MNDLIHTDGHQIVDSSEQQKASANLLDINLASLEAADSQASRLGNFLLEKASIPEAPTKELTSTEHYDSEADEVKHAFIARINDIIQKGKILNLPSLYKSLRIGDSLFVTPATTLRNDYKNAIVLTVLKTENPDKGRKYIKLVDLKSGATYRIDRDSIKPSGELTVFNTQTERYFTYAKIHALETVTSQTK